MVKSQVSVIGHKNPDTDSICAAIGYAYLKNKLSDEEYTPKRAGQISPETEFVLKSFSQKIPDYVNDVRAQVKDVSLNLGECVDKSLSLKNAWGILNSTDAGTLAAVDSSGRLEGLITMGDIARSFMGVYNSRILSEARTPYKNILGTLQGEMLVGDPSGFISEGKVLVAAANPDLMEEYMEPGDTIILSDRYESQLCAIEMDAGCLVVCMGGEISGGILTLARERGCTVIRTEYDTFIAARIMNQSIPIEHFMVKENLLTFCTDDYIEDIKGIMAKRRHRDFPVLDEDGRFCGLLSRHGLLELDRKKVILVDHNEMNQAVDGIEEAEILEIIDHHKLGHVQTGSPVLFRNQPVGSTSTIIFLMFREHKVPVPKNIAGLLCSAIISDTLLFRSPTCTAADKLAALELAKTAGINPETYAREMFSAGSDLESKSAQDVFYQDFKKFKAGKVNFGVGQVTSMDTDELTELRERMIPFMRSAKENHALDMLFFMLTDILKENTVLICAGNGAKDAVREGFSVTAAPGEDYVVLDGVVSRKKQLIPKLMRELQQ